MKDGVRSGMRAGGFPALWLLWASLAFTGCGVKRQVVVAVAPGIEAAKTASLQDLLAILRDSSDKITSLSSMSLKVSLTTGKAERGKLQEYRSAPGYILLRRPDHILVTIQNPITKTSILELLSVGDQFEVLNRRDNKLYIGRNSAREFEIDSSGPGFTARPTHILEAILPQPLPLDRPDRRVMLTEEQDAAAKYYVLTLLQDAGEQEMRPLRRSWIERSEMALIKEETFTSTGQLASIVRYSILKQMNGVRLPLGIHIDRPRDGYQLDLQFKDWRVNPSLPDSAFVLQAPPGAERVILKEKTRSNDW
jgi:hypothetical protein